MEIKVIPSSGKNKWVRDKSGQLKCYLKNPPERGLANRELIKLIAKALNMPQNKIEIISGATSRKKRVKIEIDKTVNDFLKIIGVEQQIPLFKK